MRRPEWGGMKIFSMKEEQGQSLDLEIDMANISGDKSERFNLSLFQQPSFRKVEGLDQRSTPDFNCKPTISFLQVGNTIQNSPSFDQKIIRYSVEQDLTFNSRPVTSPSSAHKMASGAFGSQTSNVVVERSPKLKAVASSVEKLRQLTSFHSGSFLKSSNQTQISKENPRIQVQSSAFLQNSSNRSLRPDRSSMRSPVTKHFKTDQFQFQRNGSSSRGPSPTRKNSRLVSLAKSSKPSQLTEDVAQSGSTMTSSPFFAQACINLKMRNNILDLKAK